MALTGHRFTAEEYLSLPPDDRFTQLIDGEIVVNQPSVRHQDITGLLYRRLAEWSEVRPERGRAGIPVDVVVDETNVLVPDVWWVADDHRPSADALRLDRPPDLAVEVRSPPTWRYDVGAKKAAYERAGLPELWLVDTESETVLVYRRAAPESREFDVALELGAGEALWSPLLPGFTLPVAGIFAP